MMKRLIACLGLTLLMSAAAFADEPPPWLKQAASTESPAYGKEVRAVVLHDEQRKTVGDDGKIVSTTWWAVKILSREGRGSRGRVRVTTQAPARSRRCAPG
jgi:hypothetical protein